MSRVLVAVDTSPRAPLVLKAAIDLAQKSGARLSLLHVAHPPIGLPASLFTVSTDSLLALLVDEGNKHVMELARLVPAELLEGARVVAGTPWEVICKEARSAEASLIVIGAHGYGRIEQLTGTTAARVVNHADRSVLVVRAS
jgi:nucleotide-binding universal stress UspA family protein